MRAWSPRLWWTLPEPRLVAATLTAWYVGCGLLGARLLWLPDWTGHLDVMAWMLLAGGIVAASACLAGQWWIERAGMILLAAAWAIRGSMLLATPPPSVWIQVVGLSGVFALLVTRLVRIWGMPADPARTPRGVA